MADKKNNGWGGARANSGGKREGAGRPPKPRPPKKVLESTDTPEQSTGTPQQLSPAKIITPGQKWQFAEYALQHAYEALDGMIELMRSAENEAVRLNAMDKILDRALGKAPAHVDITALRHTEIVYRSTEEIRKALIEHGAPAILLDLQPEDPYADEEEEKAEEKPE